MKNLEFKGTKGEWKYSNQKGHPGHCYLAQIWKPDGKSLATIESTHKEEEANANAKLIADAPNLLKVLLKVKEVLEKEWPKEEWIEFDKEIGYSEAIEKALK